MEIIQSILLVFIYILIGIVVTNIFVKKTEDKSLYEAIEYEKNKDLKYFDDERYIGFYYMMILFSPF